MNWIFPLALFICCAGSAFARDGADSSGGSNPCSGARVYTLFEENYYLPQPYKDGIPKKIVNEAAQECLVGPKTATSSSYIADSIDPQPGGFKANNLKFALDDLAVGQDLKGYAHMKKYCTLNHLLLAKGSFALNKDFDHVVFNTVFDACDKEKGKNSRVCEILAEYRPLTIFNLELDPKGEAGGFTQHDFPTLGYSSINSSGDSTGERLHGLAFFGGSYCFGIKWDDSKDWADHSKECVYERCVRDTIEKKMGIPAR